MKTSKHSLSRYNITSLDAGKLYPVGIREVLPGDTFQHAIQAMVRMQPMVAPTMHPVHINIEHYFVPYRLVNDGWEAFITTAQGASPAFPVMNLSQLGHAGSAITNWRDCIYNYMGVQQPDVGQTFNLNAMPARAFNLIYNEYFRDQDLVSELSNITTGGTDNTSNIAVPRVAWRKDHLTTARPFAAKGPSVQIPIQSTGNDVVTTSQHIRMKTYADPTSRDVASGTGSTTMGLSSYSSSNSSVAFGNQTGLKLDLTALGIDPEDLRTGMAWYKWQEMRARYGSRYTEYMRAAFGVISPDQRLQRPEYLGGGSQTIQMSEVLQTSNPGEVTDPEDATGSLKGHGIGSVRTNAYRRFFQEHGYVISVMYIRPVSIYAQGVDTHFLKRSPFDYYQREFEATGSQAIKNGEVYMTGTDDQEGWGFQDRYYDYRRCKSYVSGDMRNIFNYWHEARIFTGRPSLNASFVTCNPSDRIFAAPVDQNYMVMIYDKCVARRAVAKIGMSSNFRA